MNVDSLKSEFRGELLTPGSDGYDAARRLWNGMIDRRPAVIARCTGPEDVMAVVRFAARENIYPAVRRRTWRRRTCLWSTMACHRRLTDEAH